MTGITLKRGDTLAVDGVVAQDAGGAVDLTGYTVRSQVRRQSGDLVSALTVTVTNAALGTFTLVAAAAETRGWAPGRHACDVEYASGGGVVSSTESFPFTVLEDVTR